MPITLAKLFSPTVRTSFLFLDETVNVVFAPLRYTGEMQDLAERLTGEMQVSADELDALRDEAAAADAAADQLDAEPEKDEAAVQELRDQAMVARGKAVSSEVELDHRGKAIIREFLARLLVSWDVLGEDGKPISTDIAELNRLPDLFLQVVFLSLKGENAPDPTKAPPSDEPSNTGESSAPSPAGTDTSPQPEPSASPRSSSTNGRKPRAATRSGARGL